MNLRAISYGWIFTQSSTQCCNLLSNTFHLSHTCTLQTWWIQTLERVRRIQRKHLLFGNRKFVLNFSQFRPFVDLIQKLQIKLLLEPTTSHYNQTTPYPHAQCVMPEKKYTKCAIHTWHSYGKNAMLISFNVLIFRAAVDLQRSLNSSSGHTVFWSAIDER